MKKENHLCKYLGQRLEIRKKDYIDNVDYIDNGDNID
jgi:hypothetical protein